MPGALHKAPKQINVNARLAVGAAVAKQLRCCDVWKITKSAHSRVSVRSSLHGRGWVKHVGQLLRTKGRWETMHCWLTIPKVVAWS